VWSVTPDTAARSSKRFLNLQQEPCQQLEDTQADVQVANRALAEIRKASHTYAAGASVSSQRRLCELSEPSLLVRRLTSNGGSTAAVDVFNMYAIVCQCTPPRQQLNMFGQVVVWGKCTVSCKSLTRSLIRRRARDNVALSTYRPTAFREIKLSSRSIATCSRLIRMSLGSPNSAPMPNSG